LDFLKSLKWVDFPYFHALKIFPNTEMERLAIENGISRQDILNSADLSYDEPKSSIKISKLRRVGFSWSALRAKFSRIENWRDGIPKARTAGGMKWKEMATKPHYNLMKDLG
jgi:hypothetical protein